MPDTFSQIYIHIVFAVEGRQNLIRPEHGEHLHRYITGIVTHQGQKLIAINSMPDHIHILVGLKPSMAISDLVAAIKRDSSAFINKSKWGIGHFRWQEGFGAFSYSHSHLTAVIQYIKNQPQHHQQKTFREEYLTLLEKYKIPYDPKYIFKPAE